MTKKLVNILEIKPNTDNPRIIKDHKFKKLVKSIKDFPEMLEKRPIVVDENMIVLGGNMRLKALLEAGVKDVWIDVAEGWTEEQKKEFIIKDNVGFGDWDWDILANEWEPHLLEDWALNLPGFDIDQETLTDEFELPDGDKSPFQQMTFTLADEQAEQIKNAIADIKKTEEFKYAETFANENSNGNALYLIVMQWAEQRK
jgi:hypothetical protein